MATGDVRFALTSGKINSAISNPFPSYFYPPSPVTGTTTDPWIQVRANAFLVPSPPIPSPTPGSNETGKSPGSNIGTPDGETYDGFYFGELADAFGGGNDWKNVDRVGPVFQTDGSGNLPIFQMQVQVPVYGAPPPPPIPSPTPPHPAPYITNQPADQTVAVGQTATFSVIAGGTAPLSYQWMKNGVNITNATNSSYTTPQVTVDQNGSVFAVVVNSGFGPVTSDNATLHTITSLVWKPYQQWKSAAQSLTPTAYCSGIHPASHWKQRMFQDPEYVLLDPRTVRFGVWVSDANGTGNGNDYESGLELTMDQNNGGDNPQIITGLKPQPVSSFPSSSGTNYYLYSSNATANEQYADLDNVKRRGDWTTDAAGTANTKTIMYASPTPAGTPNPSATPPNSQDRPRNLSMPFQSVAELGQVFRDQPWKTLNFTVANSGDAGLLDVFTLQGSEQRGVAVLATAGRTSLNTRQSAVLTAILSQAAKNLVASNIITTAQAKAVSIALTNLTAANPMISKGELVTRLAADLSVAGLGNKEARECVVRAFSDACQTRTWNLLIDVIAQSGRYPPNATSFQNGFVVEGEKHYWVHVAIDRFTGQVLDKQIEVVNE